MLKKGKLIEDGDVPMARYSVRLTIRQKRVAKKLGQGNLGAGIRILINSYVVENKKPPS